MCQRGVFCTQNPGLDLGSVEVIGNFAWFATLYCGFESRRIHHPTPTGLRMARHLRGGRASCSGPGCGNPRNYRGFLLWVAVRYPLTPGRFFYMVSGHGFDPGRRAINGSRQLERTIVEQLAEKLSLLHSDPDVAALLQIALE